MERSAIRDSLAMRARLVAGSAVPGLRFAASGLRATPHFTSINDQFDARSLLFWSAAWLHCAVFRMDDAFRFK
jgi:hypothetical protein